MFFRGITQTKQKGGWQLIIASSVTKGTAINKDSDFQGPRPKLAWFCYCYRNSPLLSQKPLERLSPRSWKDQSWRSADLTALTASPRKLPCKERAGENTRNTQCGEEIILVSPSVCLSQKGCQDQHDLFHRSHPHPLIVLLLSSSPPGEVPPLLPFTLHPRTCLINCIPAWWLLYSTPVQS